MKIVYIAHPISGDVAGNLEKIGQIVREINLTERNVVPFAPYWLDCHALDDTIPAERERGIRNDQELITRCVDEVWCYGDRISNGMKAEIELAQWLGKAVVFKSKSLMHREAINQFEIDLAARRMIIPIIQKHFPLVAEYGDRKTIASFIDELVSVNKINDRNAGI